MRILHTSDWHFGRTLHGVDLAPAVDLFCDWLVDTVRGEGVDLVLVSGDVYDRPIPPTRAVEQLESVLHRLCEVATVVLTSGNHDSATRLGFGSSLLRDEIKLVTSVADIGSAVEFTSGAGESVLIYPLPYMEPDAVRHPLGRRLALLNGEDEDLDHARTGRSHHAVMNAAMELITEDLRGRRENGVDSPAIAMVHAFITGGHASDSERRIEVGGVEDVPSRVFDLPLDVPLAYIAAGHLHRPQDISGAHVPIRYSGSPIAYSFSEAGSHKSVTLLDVKPDSSVEQRDLAIPVWRDLAVIRGSLDEVLSDKFADLRQYFVSVTVTDAERPPRLKQRVLDAFPYAVVVVHESSHSVRLDLAPSRAEQRSDRQVCTAFFEELGGRALSPEEDRVFSDLLTDMRVQGAQA